MSQSFIPRLSTLVAYTVPLFIAIASFLAFKDIQQVEKIHNFVLKSKREFPEYSAVAYLYVHAKHGSPFLNIETSDTHNFFATTFRTTCLDDTGSTHVLEHLSLHGSENYPINSIFTELLKRSLATLLNAFTSIEWTAYPFSSTNFNDFHNILSVYLDATFHPQLNEIAFESECHHLEFQVPNDTTTNLRHSGVVYNEMNGELSNPTSRFETLIRRNLFPDSVLGLEYGGNPKDIATLTLDKIKEQHNRYYHPSNAIFYHYGSFGLEEIMKKVDDIISPFDTKIDLSQKSPIISEELVNQPRWENPHPVVADGPSSSSSSTQDDTKIRASVNWIVGDLRNISEVVDLNFLSLLLVDSNASPLYKALIKSGLGSRFIDTGFMPYTRSSYFSIGLEGVDESNSTVYNKVVLKALEEVYRNGFDKERIDSVLNQYELSLKHVPSDQGFRFWMNIIGSWIHDVSPFELLDESWQIERIKRVLAINPRYFEMILKHEIIDNTHRLDLVMRGVKNFLEKQNEATKKELEKVKQKMTKEDLEKIVKKTKTIQDTVDAPKPLHLLPSIQVKDLNDTQSDVKFELVDQRIFTFVQPTNDIVYIRFKVEIPAYSKDIMLLPILASVLTNVGADDLNEENYTNKVQLNTGGIHTSYSIIPSEDSADKFKVFFEFSGSSLSRDVETLLQLMEKTIKKPWLNNTKQIGLMLSMMSATVKENIASSGHIFAMKYSASGYSKAATLDEMLSGVTFQRFLMMMAKTGERDMNKISTDLTNAYRDMVMKGAFSASIHCKEDDKIKVNNLVNGLLKTLPNTVKEDIRSQLIAKYHRKLNQHPNTHLLIDSSTYFCGVSAPIPYFSNPTSPSYSVAAKLINSEFLHDAIREKLGAYGSMSSANARSAYVSFLSYRDTNPMMVLKAIDESIKTISEGNINDDMIKRAIVQVFSKLDTPVAPKDCGLDYFFDAISYNTKQTRRTAFLKTNKQQIINDFIEISKAKKRKVIVGGSINSLTSDWFVFDVFDLNTTSFLEN